MTLLKTTTKVDNLEQLRQRKAALKAKLDAEQADLLAGYQVLRTELDPTKLLTNVARSLLGMSETGAAKASGEPGLSSRFSGPLQVVADLLIREPRMRFLFKYIAPLLISYLPQRVRRAKEITPEKAEVYGFMRRSVSGLRKQFHRKKTTATEEEPQLPAP